jgi:hypothetical protein
MKNWKTTLFGALAALPSFLHGIGINIGHVGQGDWLTFVQGLFIAGVGLAAKDRNVTGGNVGQTPEAQIRTNQ